MRLKVSVVLMIIPMFVLFAVAAYAGIHKEGKAVLDMSMGVKSVVDIVKMEWGKLDDKTDRITGSLKRYDVPLDVVNDVVLTFDFTGTNGEVIASQDLSVDFHKYGWFDKKSYYEAPFCFDFPTDKNYRKAVLTNVRIEGKPVYYEPKFNMSAALLRTLFTLKEPPKGAKANTRAGAK